MAGDVEARQELRHRALEQQLALLLHAARGTSELAAFMRPRVARFGPTPVVERTIGLAQELEREIREVLARVGQAA